MSYREGRFWQPDVTVATVVVRDGRVLCVEERVNGDIVINQPAGHLEPDESLADAALRETREEVGLRDLRLIGPIRIIDWHFRANSCARVPALCNVCKNEHVVRVLAVTFKSAWCRPAQETRKLRAKIHSRFFLDVPDVTADACHVAEYVCSLFLRDGRRDHYRSRFDQRHLGFE